MTLEEAIVHCVVVANDRAECAWDCVEEHKQFAEWLKELKERREKQEWIPCSERLPETKDIDDWVKTLVCSSDESIAVGSFNSEYGWTFSHWFGETIAWMPLPTVYKEGADEPKTQSIDDNSDNENAKYDCQWK